MAVRIAFWAFAALFVVIGGIALWLGSGLVQWLPGEAIYYLLTGGLFLAATAWMILKGLRGDPGDALVIGLGAAFAAFLLSVASYFLIKGSTLMSMGGSWYYVVAGLAMAAVAVLMVLRNVWAARIWAALVGVTVVWSLWEAGLDFWPLLTRLAAFVVVGLWFIAPWTRALFVRGPERVAPQGVARWNLAALGAGALALIIAAFIGFPVQQGSRFGNDGVVSADWTAYGNTTLGTRFSTLDQINTQNVRHLSQQWSARTRVPYDFKDTPLAIDGVVYICTAGNTVIALDGDSGVEKWRRSTDTKVPGGRGASGLDGASTFARSCRGLGYYDMASTARAVVEAPAAPASPTPAGVPGPQAIPSPAPAQAAQPAAAAAGDCPRRIITGTTDARLLAINADTGEICRSFGDNGAVNLRAGMGPHGAGDYMVTSAPLVARDIVVVGGWVVDNQRLGNPSGVIRAYSARTGQFMWAWDLGKPEHHTMPDEGEEFTRGTPNAWSTTSYDPELNLIYAPTGNSSPDYFAGELRTQQAEKYSSSVVAIDASTGEAKWVYQTVHHDIWDYDAPSQPVLVNVRRDGVLIPAVAQPTKRGEIFLLDRRTGEPVYPIPEQPVPQNPEVGENVTATQPFSPLPNFREDRNEDDMWGLTPLDQLYCRVEFRKMRYEGHFTPPMRGVTPGYRAPEGYEPSYAERRFVGGEQSGGTFQYPGNAGGFNWGSVSVDADNGLLFAAPMQMGNRITLSSAEDRRVQGEAARARQERWWAAHPDDKRRYDAAVEAARARGGGFGFGPPPAAAAAPRGGPGGPGSAPAPGPQAGTAQQPGNPEGGPVSAPRRDTRFDQSRVNYSGNTVPFMSAFHVPFLGDTQVPCFEPPFGVIAAIDLNTNRLMWRRPFGTMQDSGPFGWKSGLPFDVGTPIQSGSMTTRGGLVFHAGAMDSKIRAYDERTGQLLWSSELPGSAHATPMTYRSASGRQMVVVTVPNPSWEYPRPAAGAADAPSDDQGGYVIAYALDDF
jgi:membrane-bound PQQ-dependent dehydrogenase (glucose/quinate/shikimate family)